MKRLFNRCSGRQKQISLLVSGALPKSEKAEVENHLALCPDCQAYFDEMKTVSALLAGCRSDSTVVEPSQAVQSRWHNAILASAETSSPPSSILSELWCELIWPCRRVITGTAAAWLIMWAANTGIIGASTGIAGGNDRQVPGAWQNYAEQRQFFAELMKSEAVPPAESPRRSVPRPRGDAMSRTKFC